MDINEIIKPEVYGKNTDIAEDDDKEREDFLDEEWVAQNGSDACDNCGHLVGRNHSCEA